VRLTRAETIAATRQFLGEWYGRFRFLTAPEAERAQSRRDELLAALNSRARSACLDSKLHLGGLSPGCRQCAAGSWSCLYLNHRCNADCFFCRGGGYKDGPDPGTRADGLPFRSEGEYSDFVGRGGITAVSFSGGEPLLTFGRLLRYLRRLRRDHGDGLYIWLYTNGLALTDEKLVQLRAEGLDEIRFNLYASNYDLDRLGRAARHLDTVTVEIPAIPEDRARLRQLLPELEKRGVSHLNLHQLMALDANMGELLARGYTFAHGPAPPVVESELMVLELMRSALDMDLRLGIHYCSWIYKSRWHVRSRDARLAALAREGRESVTQRGLLRKTWLAVGAEVPESVANRLKEADPEGNGWCHHRAEGRLYLHPRLLRALPRPRRELSVAYFRPVVDSGNREERQAPTREARQIRISRRRRESVLLEQVSAEIALTAQETEAFLDVFPGKDPAPRQPGVAALDRFEHVESGRPDYF
jgi:pyruvate formate-lyase activating enzyme-like uncharacterized protein